MDWFVKAFLKASLAWLALGVTLGVAMAIHPVWAVYRTAHMHANLLGFVSMMIFGVAYHVIPRFTGHPLHSRALAASHWWIANTGLALFVTGFALVPNGIRGAWMVIALAGTLSALGAYAFVYNLWRTIDGPSAVRRPPVRSSVPQARRLPVVETAGRRAAP
jgi:cbb3-type cytochrome oxidase subunit 1